MNTYRAIRLHCLALIVLPVAVAGQSALTTANGTSSLITSDAGSLSVDLNESKVSATFFNRGTILPTSPNYHIISLTLSGAATKGSRNIFSKGELNPEFGVSLSAAYNFEERAAGFFAPFAVLGFTAAPNKYVVTDAGSVASMGDATSQAWKATAGINIGFTENSILGAAVSYTSDQKSVAGFQTREVCTTEASTTNGPTEIVSVRACADRFVGLPRSVRSGHARIDWTPKVWVPSDAGADNAATFGLIVSSSMDWNDVPDEADPAARFNFSIGPSLHPEGAPSNLRGAVLFEFTDLTNEADESWGDRFFVRLYARVPFSVF